MSTTTEQRRQAYEDYKKNKKEYPNFLCLFRIGDFYEAFGDGAETLGRVCGIHVGPAPIGLGLGPVGSAAVAAHSVRSYAKKLIAKGARVALCEPPEGEATQRRRDLEALRYAGAMGHVYATVRTSGDGITSVTGEYSTVKHAKRLSSPNDRVYRHTAKGWRRVGK